MSNPPSVLAVCTGNISRSPAVEYLLKRALPGVDGRSAGVAAVVGAGVDAPVADYLRGRGLDVSGFASRQLTPAMIADADLVLPLTRQHRAWILDRVPAAVRRTYTLREFARVLESLEDVPAGKSPAERLTAVLPRVAAGRSLAPRRPAAEDDVEDPYGYGPEVYRRSLTDIQQAVDLIAARLSD
ncbi:MAG: hypothetical protein KIT69_04000 [Propionibacteriaceae bacterium]|nr:hypothetical protein [Propionibacteriaceae bacterium]